MITREWSVCAADSSAPRPLFRHVSPVNRHRMASDVGGRIRAQPRDRLAYLARLAQPLERLGGSEALFHLGAIGQQAPEHRCADRPRAYAIDTDFFAAILECRRARQPD